MRKVLFTVMVLIFLFISAKGQGISVLDSFRVNGDINVTIDRPTYLSSHRETILIFYALPNGNTTGQTMGKKMQPGDDWHFDIQHIRAQTRFIRGLVPRKNFVVIYLENDYKSWPSWKQRHPDFPQKIPALVDSLASLIYGASVSIYLNGHSGGGSFIFGYLAGVTQIPSAIKRISFLDSDYGYDSSYYNKIRDWLKNVKGSALNVFAYNDSIALYNGKPLVSATGGTWYRSHLLLRHLQQDFRFQKKEGDSLIIYKSPDRRVQFFFKRNPDRGIYHTQQVELNGFIHSVLCGTNQEQKKYTYYGKRAYNDLVE
jgi:hypothetical protein